MTLRRGGAPLNIANGIREFARSSPDTVAVIDGDRRLTYRGLHDRSSRVAQALLAGGAQPGRPVAVLMGNRMEYLEVAAGLAKAGMPMVPINPRGTAHETAFILGHSGAQAVVLDDALAGLLPADHGLARTLTLADGQPDSDYETALRGARAVDPAVPCDEHDPFCISYTSGTTGQPKGVLLSHRSRCLTFYASALQWGMGPGRRTIAVAPLYHGAGFAFGYGAVFTGGTVSVLRSWDPVEFLDLCERDAAQSVFLVPTHAQLLRRVLDDTGTAARDLRALQTLYFNAAALPVRLKEWVLDTFPGVGVHELYGSTEASIVTDLRPEHARTRAGSVGHPWFMTEVRVVGDDGHPVAPGETGELYSRSPYLMNGYLDDDAATMACTTPDGFFSAGDLVTVDDEGFISIVDRKNDIIVSGGVNVYPREVEEALRRHVCVDDVAVIGVPDETWGESVCAVVVTVGDVPVPAGELEAFLRRRLAGYKIPKEWRQLAALPRNATGKVLKRSLRGGAPAGP